MDMIFEWLLKHPGVTLRMTHNNWMDEDVIHLDMSYLLDTCKCMMINTKTFNRLRSEENAFINILDAIYEELVPEGDKQ